MDGRASRAASGSMTLGRRTLRADAVPVAAISVLQFSVGLTELVKPTF